MKKGIFKPVTKLITLMAVFTVFTVFAPLVHADSVNIDIIAENEEVTEGQLVEVDLVLKSSVRLGGFESYLTYNAGTLEFQSDRKSVV